MYKNTNDKDNNILKSSNKNLPSSESADIQLLLSPRSRKSALTTNRLKDSTEKEPKQTSSSSDLFSDVDNFLQKSVNQAQGTITTTSSFYKNIKSTNSDEKAEPTQSYDSDSDSENSNDPIKIYEHIKEELLSRERLKNKINSKKYSPNEISKYKKKLSSTNINISTLKEAHSDIFKKAEKKVMNDLFGTESHKNNKKNKKEQSKQENVNLSIESTKDRKGMILMNETLDKILEETDENISKEQDYKKKKQRELKDWQNKYGTSQKKIDILEKKMLSSDISDDDKIRMLAELEEYKAENIRANNQLNELIKQVKESNTKIQQLEDRKNELLNNIDNKDNELQEKQKELEISLKQNEEQEKKIDNAINKINLFLKTEYNENYGIISGDIEKNNSKIFSKTKSIEEAKGVLEENNLEIEKLRKENPLDEMIKQLMNDNIKLRSHIKKDEVILSRLEHNKKSLEAELNKLKEYAQEEELKIAKLEKLKSSLENDKQHLNNELHNLNKQLEQERFEKQNLIQQNDTLQSRMRLEKEQDGTIINNLTNQLQNIELEKKQKEQVFNLMKENESNASDALTKLREDHAAYMIQKEQETRDLQDRINKFLMAEEKAKGLPNGEDLMKTFRQREKSKETKKSVIKQTPEKQKENQKQILSLAKTGENNQALENYLMNNPVDRLTTQELLELAKINENKELLTILIRTGMDLNIKDSEGNNLIAISSLSDNQEVFDYLMFDPEGEGNDINNQNNFGETALMLTARFQSNIYYLKKLIENNTNKELQDMKGKTAIMFACERSDNNTEALQYLITSKANIGHKNHEGYGVMSYTILRNKAEHLQILLNYDNSYDDYIYDTSSSKDKSARISDSIKYYYKIAVRNNYVEVSEMLKNKFPQILNQYAILLDQAKMRALYGAEIGSYDIAKSALDLYLSKASSHVNQLEDIEYLKHQNLFLHTAVSGGSLKLVKCLVEEKGADINKQNKVLLNTPLHIAADKNHLNICKYLLQKGANPLTVNQAGETAIEVAARNGHDGIVNMLLPYYEGQDLIKKRVVENMLLNACKESNEVKVAELLTKYKYKNIIDINRKYGDEENSLLHYAAKNGNLKICQMLVENKIAFTKNKYGFNPIQLAGEEGHIMVARFLSTSFKHLSDITPQVLVNLVRNKASKKEVVTNLETRDSITGDTILHILAKQGNIEEIKNLLGKLNDSWEAKSCLEHKLNFAKDTVKSIICAQENGWTNWNDISKVYSADKSLSK